MNWKQNFLLLSLLSFAPLQALQSAEIGQALSSCVLTQLSKNDQNKLERLENKVLYLDFWASWCPPCAKSFSFLNELHKQYHAEGLAIIAINLDEVPEDAKDFLSRYPADFTVDLDFNRQCAKDLGISAMPSSFLVDQNRIIRHIHLGFRPSQAADLRNQVEQLLSKSLSTVTPI